MSSFMKRLPVLLNRSDVVLEVRDARLPLSSINPNFEAHMAAWKGKERTPSDSVPSQGKQRIVIMNKRDLVPPWGIDPFVNAFTTLDPTVLVRFVSSKNRDSIKQLHQAIVSFANTNRPEAETNVLVVGMPNVGKSTILNSLRSLGIPGRTPKALQTSAFPGKTRALSTRLKLSETPRVYAYDTPGVMVPFLGKGTSGAERGIKLALIAGIKESMYDIKFLAEYLLYRLFKQDPVSPPYTVLLPDGTNPDMEVEEFLDHLARRLGMLLPGGDRDHLRAAGWFVRWWRGQASRQASGQAKHLRFPLMSDSSGWGLDFDWTLSHLSEPSNTGATPSPDIENKMAEIVKQFSDQVLEEQKAGAFISQNQERKQLKHEQQLKRTAKWAANQ